jgi:molybdenum cofactor guanylyltransferase
MGTPKALLAFGGEPLIVHVVRALGKLFGEIVVVAAPDQELPEVLATVVRDDVAYQGPVGGIYNGLRSVHSDYSFITACDVPFLNLPLISRLLGKITDYDVVVPYWQNRFQPLHAVYRAGVVDHLQRQLERAELRPIFLYDKVRTCKIEEEEIRRFDPEGWSFFNMNTPEDYHNALQRWALLAPEIGQSHTAGFCTVELFGVARLRARRSEVSLALPPDAAIIDVLHALAQAVPALVGPVLIPDENRLAAGHACNLNGHDFVRDLATRVVDGDRILILSADAGG